MKNRILGNNHLTVSSIGLGCWGMSHAYGDGHNEELIAKVLKRKRKGTVIGTKFGFVGDEHGNVKINGRPDYVQLACEKSLKRLGIDEIDLYYFHRLDPDVPIEKTVGAMADLIEQGKIRYIGLSEVSAKTIRSANSVHPITALQSEYSLWQRDVERNILPVCKELNISLIPFSPLGRGFLTGTILNSGSFEDNDYRHQIPRFNSDAIEKNRSVIDKLQQLATKNDVSPSQLSLAWLLAQDDFIVLIPGMKRRKYIEENLAAVELSLPDDVIQDLNHLHVEVSGNRHNTYNLQFIDTES